MKMFKTLAVLAVAGGAAYWAYNQWFKKPAGTTVATTTPMRLVATAEPLQPMSGLSGSRPLSVF